MKKKGKRECVEENCGLPVGVDAGSVFLMELAEEKRSLKALAWIKLFETALLCNHCFGSDGDFGARPWWFTYGSFGQTTGTFFPDFTQLWSVV